MLDDDSWRSFCWRRSLSRSIGSVTAFFNPINISGLLSSSAIPLSIDFFDPIARRRTRIRPRDRRNQEPHLAKQQAGSRGLNAAWRRSASWLRGSIARYPVPNLADSHGSGRETYQKAGGCILSESARRSGSVWYNDMNERR